MKVLVLGMATCLLGQDVSITVWQPSDSPAAGAKVVVSRALNLASARNYLQTLAATSAANEYANTLTGAPELVDVLIQKSGYHTLTIRDLSIRNNRNQSIHVQLLPVEADYRAPECFSFKTQYEFLFRKEQQLTPPEEQQLSPEVRRSRAAHRARVKYVDAILALPNPNRPDSTQSVGTRGMIDEMARTDHQGYEELRGMMKGLFDLFAMQGTDQFSPSTWKSEFVTPSGRARSCAVAWYGTKGTYTTEDGTVHGLEQVDIAPFDGPDGFYYLVTGIWRFQGGGPGDRGGFQWKIDENGSKFTGVYWADGREREQRAWNGELVSDAQ